LELCSADHAAWIADIVQHDKVNAFVIEGVVGGTKKFLIGLTRIE